MNLSITQHARGNASDATSLTFAKSESKMVGAQGKTIDMIKKYALRAAGWLKVPTFLAVIYAAFENPANQFNPYRLVAGTLMLSTVLILALYGKKKDGEELTDEQKAKAAELESKGLRGEVEKVLHFKDYPVEAAGGIGIIGSMFTMLSGLIGAPSIVAAETAIGPFAIAASVFLWISRDKKEPAKEEEAEAATDSLTFAKSESKQVGGTNGFTQFVKDEIIGKPVRTASILFLGASAMQLATGFNLFGLGSDQGTDIGFIMAGIFSAVSNVLTLLFVRKSDYNIEQDDTAKETADAKPEKPKSRVKEASNAEPILSADTALGVA